MSKRFKLFCKDFAKMSKKEILRVFYEYIRKEKDYEKKRN